MKRRVSFLGSRVHIRSPVQQLRHHMQMSILGRQMQRIQSVGVGGVDVHIVLELLDDLVQVTCPRRPQEGGVALP